MYTQRTIQKQCIDVMGSIYRGCSEPSQLRYGAKLSSESLDKVLDYLGEKDMVLEVDMGNGEVVEYFLTEKGLMAVELYRQVNKYINQNH